MMIITADDEEFIAMIKKIDSEKVFESGGDVVRARAVTGGPDFLTHDGNGNVDRRDDDDEEDDEKSKYKCLVKLYLDGEFKETKILRYFINKEIRYIWYNERERFQRITGLDEKIKCEYFYRHGDGLSALARAQREIFFGRNSIEVKVQTIVEILFKEVLGPFYVFQVFSMILWCFEEYFYYASCIFVMSILSLTTNVIQIRRNQKQLHDTVVGSDKVTVFRNSPVGLTEEIESTALVPGDVIAIPACGGLMYCDAILLSGNVIVNESMLTGESVPVTKIPLPHYSEELLYNSKEHSKHTLFSGTKVIQTRYYDSAAVKAIVIRTGYLTSKGELVRSIMFPKPVDFKFNRHIYKFIKFLACLAAIGFVYTVIIKIMRQVPFTDIALKALDLITIIIPPALPAAMTIGIVYAQSRLKDANIFCISPRSINISGCINCVCFDKTGTLTEDDLSFAELVPVERKSKRFGAPIKNADQLGVTHLTTCLATCHSLTLIDGQLIGDPLDQKMFEAVNWTLEEPEIDDTNKYDLLAPTIVKKKIDRKSTTATETIFPMMDVDGNDDGIENEKEIEIGVLRQFPFSSSLQRMSVVTRSIVGSEFIIYSKGSPEMISSLCVPSSLPENFSEILMEYTEDGYRVLALAYRPLTNCSYAKMQRATREWVECDLQFLGLLVMGNLLKPETTHIIETLSASNIRSIMVTGDNMLTALSVAHDCSMILPHEKVVLLECSDRADTGDIPEINWKFANSVKSGIKSSSEYISVKLEDSGERLHVALNGKTFKALRDYYPDILSKVAIKGTVFARMAPEQKQQLVELLQDLGYYVAMCGDGANDCGALKAANAGVSLSDSEASVASPFTSKTPNISCIPTLIREGRASLVTAFGIVKYMALYSIIQFFSVILLYTMYTNLTDLQFLYQDLFLISLFFIFFGKTEASEKLDKHAPPSTLIALTPLVSIIVQVTLVIVFQMSAEWFLWTQPWYKSHTPSNDDDYKCHDNYAVFAVSVFQYISLAVVFSKGAPYRKPIYTNYPFLISIIAMTIFTVYIVVWPTEWLSEQLEYDLTNVDYDFRYVMVLLALINLLLFVFAEEFIVDYLTFKKLRLIKNKYFPHKQKLYKRILEECKEDVKWLRKKNFTDTYNNRTGDLNFVHDQQQRSETRKQIFDDDDDDVENEKINRSPSESGISISSPSSRSSKDTDNQVDHVVRL